LHWRNIKLTECINSVVYRTILRQIALRRDDPPITHFAINV